MLRSVFLRLRNANLKLKMSKCRFLQRETQFLGFKITGAGVSTCQDKVSKVLDWAQPSSVTEVKQFLGLASYYRRFIRSFSRVAAPLHALTKKDARFHWTDACSSAFRLLKLRLTSAPVLAYPDFSAAGAPFLLDTDASNVGMGGILSQVQGGEERVIAYASQLLSKSQRNYSTYDRELLAVVHFTRHFHCYLLGKSFTLRTDHQAIRSLQSMKEPSGKHARWIEFLASYQYTVLHRPGRKHRNADALSRFPGCTSSETVPESDPSVSPECDAVPDANVHAVESSRPVPPDLFVQPEVSFISRTELRECQQGDAVLTHVLSWYDHGTGAFVRPPESAVIGVSREVRRFTGDISLMAFCIVLCLRTLTVILLC